MNSLRKLLLAVLLVAPLAAAAEDAPAKEEAPKIVYSGLVDAYYTANLTQSQAVDNADTRSYDGLTGFNLNWAKFGATMAPEPVGFKIDLAFGPESFATTQDYVLQAYASAKLGPGVLDFGLFTTSAGFELFESNANWLYTRGLIYRLLLPTSHQGARYTMDMGNGLTLQGSLSNGWEVPSNDEIVRTGSPRKTGHVSAFYAGETVTGAASVYYGKENGAADPTLLLDGNVGTKLGALEVNLSGAYVTIGDFKGMGANLSGRYTVSDALKVAGRFELVSIDTGPDVDSENIWNVSGALIHPIGNNLEMRAELRYDKASQDIFEKTSTGAEVTDGIATAHFAVMAWF
jgi:hypothetical protein